MPYKCEECGKTFSKARRKVYYGHLKQHRSARVPDSVAELQLSHFFISYFYFLSKNVFVSVFFICASGPNAKYKS